MSMYESFASVYDMFMDNVPYEEWGSHIVEQLKSRGIRDGLVLDLGCGTGVMTRYLSSHGYDMIGVDGSEEMLEMARNAGPNEEDAAAREEMSDQTPSILYLLQDMREFELYGTVKAVVSVCDCMNYMTTQEDLLQVFRLVNNYLDPGGVFLFDMNTHYKYSHILADNTFAESREECSFIWENTFYREEQINEYDLTLFRKQDNGLYRRFHETHYQRAWTRRQVESLLKTAGLRLEAVTEGYSGKTPGRTTDRLLFAAREIQK